MTFGPAFVTSGDVDFSVIKEANRRTFFAKLDEMQGTKALVWDAELAPSFSLIAGFKEIQEHNVKNMFHLQKGPAPSAQVQHLVYVARPELSVVEMIADSIRTSPKNDAREFHILLVPTKSIICEKKLQDLGVLEKLKTLEDLPIYFFNTDNDVLSMEIPRCLKNCLLLNDRSYLNSLVSGLLEIEQAFGVIPNMYSKGDWSEAVVKMLRRRRAENPSPSGSPSSIHSLMIFDRTVDFVTPLVTQLTYEGLIDELYQIRNTIVKLPKEKFSSEPVVPTQKSQEPYEQPTAPLGAAGNGPEMKQLVLNSSEDLYAELRDLNFNAVGPALRKTVKSVSEQLDQRHSASTVREYKEFVKRLPQLQAARQSAGNHMAIAELLKERTIAEAFLEGLHCEQELLNCIDTDRVMPYIEECLAKGEPVLKVLRLICLQALTCDGLKPKVLDQYRREVLQTYGLEYLPLILSLERCGLLPAQGAKNQSTLLKAAEPGSTYANLRKALRLIVDDVDEHSPNDVSYVYSGYAPLLVRLCQYCLKPGWRTMHEVLKRLPGPTGIDDEEQVQRLLKKSSTTGMRSDVQKVVLAVFIGGVTSAEVSALRYLASKEEGLTFLVLTTNLVTGNRMLEGFKD